MGRDGAIARTQRGGAGARADGPLGDVEVACRVRHQARVEGDANQGLIDVGDHVSEASLEVAEHLVLVLESRFALGRQLALAVALGGVGSACDCLLLFGGCSCRGERCNLCWHCRWELQGLAGSAALPWREAAALKVGKWVVQAGCQVCPGALDALAAVAGHHWDSRASSSNEHPGKSPHRLADLG